MRYTSILQRQVFRGVMRLENEAFQPALDQCSYQAQGWMHPARYVDLLDGVFCALLDPRNICHVLVPLEAVLSPNPAA